MEKVRADLIARIRSLIDDYGWNAHSQGSQINSQLGASQFEAPTEENLQNNDFNFENFEEDLNTPSSFSTQNLKNQIPEKIHYSLQIFWEITLRVIILFAVKIFFLGYRTN